MDNNMDWLKDFLDESIPLWRNDPVMYFREVLSFEPDTKNAIIPAAITSPPSASYPRISRSFSVMICKNIKPDAMDTATSTTESAASFIFLTKICLFLLSFSIFSASILISAEDLGCLS